MPKKISKQITLTPELQAYVHKNTLHYFALDMPGMAIADFGSAVPPVFVFGAPTIFETLSFMVSTESFATP